MGSWSQALKTVQVTDLNKRDVAWEVIPYPCVGLYMFIRFDITLHDEYAEVVQRLSSGNESLLDLGCGLGQDLRALTADGVPSEKLVAIDIHGDLWPIGMDLFRDQDRFKAQFIEANILDEVDKYRHLGGQMDMIFIADMLHMFQWDQQVVLAKECLQLLKQKPGSLIFGRNAGTIGEPRWVDVKVGKAYRHNASSIQKMWNEAASKAGVQIETKAQDLPQVLAEGQLKAWLDGLRQDPLIRSIFSVRLV